VRLRARRVQLVVSSACSFSISSNRHVSATFV